MDYLENDDQFTIVNRSTEHRISKQLMRKIPYFEKMLNLDLKESKENKVELDFDEQAFKIILDWAVSNYNILIEMDNVMGLCDLADYLGLDWISKECISYFQENFSTENLHCVIPKVTKTSKCINSGALNAFICRHFLKIANRPSWIEYPIETIEYICALDLMVYSEYQVFDAIMRWAKFKLQSYLKGLLKLVRWCHLTEQDLPKIKENELFKSAVFEPIFCSPRKDNCDCTFNRAKQNYFVMIEELDSTELRINILDNNFKQLVSQVIKEDAIPSNLFHDEHISDIIYNSGMNALRIDWKQNKYTRFSPYLSYAELQQRLAIFKPGGTLTSNGEMSEKIQNGCLLLEAAESFILIRFEANQLHCLSMPIYENYAVLNKQTQFKATLLNNKVYLMSDENLYEYNIIDKYGLYKRWSHHLCAEFRFGYSLLTSSPAGDKIILIDKCTKNYICFDVNTKRKSKGRMISCSSADGQKESKPLLTLTSTFLPLNSIRTCLNSESNSDN